MPITMTRAEYQAKYGVAPVLVTPSSIDTSLAPRRMTSAEYQAEYYPLESKPNIFEKTRDVINEFNPFYQIPKMAIEGGLKTGEGLGKLLTAKTPSEAGRQAVSAVAGGVQGLEAIPFGIFESVTNLPVIKQIKTYLWQTLPSKIVDQLSPEIKSGIETVVEKYPNSPEVASDLIITGLGLSGIKELEKSKVEIQKGFQDAYAKAKKVTIGEPPPPDGEGSGTGLQGYLGERKVVKSTKVISQVANEISSIENNYSKLRTANEFSKDAGQASRIRIAQSDVLQDSVDTTGTIRTKQPGGAVEQYRAKTIDGVEGVVRENLVRLGEIVNLGQVQRELTLAVDQSGLEGADLITALNGIKKEIRGLSLKADELGNIPLVLAHDAKINTTKNINYNTPPETATYRKAIARGYKKIVENVSSFNTEEVNAELGKYLEDIKRLENLDGRKVKGGKLGKYTAQIAGNIAGAAVGGALGGLGGSALGTIVGGEVGGLMKGEQMSKTFGKGTGLKLPKNPILEQAKIKSKLPLQKDLRIADIKVGVSKDIPKTREILILEKQIARNVEAQKTAIKKGDFTLVQALKEIYQNLVAKLKEVIKKIKETPNKKGGFISNPLSRASKSSNLSKTPEMQRQQSLPKDTTISPNLQPLAQEARKYKSAEEFVNKNLPKGLKQFSEPVAKAEQLRQEFPNADIQVFGSTADFKRVPLAERQARHFLGTTKAKPDLDIIVKDSDISKIILSEKAQVGKTDLRTEYIDFYKKVKSGEWTQDQWSDFQDKLFGYSADDVVFKVGNDYYKPTEVGLQYFPANSDFAKNLSKSRPIDEVIGQFNKTKSQLTDIYNQAVKTADNVVDPLIQEARKYKTAEEFVKGQTKSNSWSEAQKTNPDLWNKGILRKDIEPYGAKGVIPKEVHSAQGKWQNYGEFDEISADKVYKRIDSGSFKGEYEDKFGNAISDNNGNVLQDVYDDATGEWIKPMVSNKELRNQLLDTFTTKEGKKYLNEVINALPKNPDGTITAYRIGKIGGGEVQSYTLSEGMAKTFSNQGTSVLPAGTPGLPTKGYKDFGALPTNMVKIDPKGIKAWSPYDAEILVEPKYVQTKSQLTDIWNKVNRKK